MLLDIEVGGEYCGLVQMSAEIVRADLLPTGSSKTKDTAANVQRDPNIFDKHIRPSDDALWDEHCTAIHGLHANHPSIVAADDIGTVWAQFLAWINSRIGRDEVVILVAYNGETCNLQWLWKLT